jgi:hypothetical protein
MNAATSQRPIATFNVYGADTDTPPAGIPQTAWLHVLSAAGIGKATGSTGTRTTDPATGVSYRITFRTQVSRDQYAIRSTTSTADVYIEDPEPDAELALLAAGDEALLTALLGLTHRVHTAEQERGRTQAQVDHAIMLRGQRDLIRAEVLRRMGGAR